ncbi:hypothetical protein ACIBCH_29045 [Amycolatopsis thailandensis]|uniref:hypothetical protein n=1 Tax=Amycolatopsis thailandensis TaxID=589330 RepID=UPI0037A83A7F
MTTVKPRTAHRDGTADTDPAAVADRLVESMMHIATDNPFVVKAREGLLTDEDLTTLVRLENATLDNVTTPIALAATRFPDTTSFDFLLEVTQTVREDKAGVLAAAKAGNTALEEYPGHHLGPVAYTYAGYINWLLVNASATSIALVAYADISLWHYACALLTPILEKRPGLPKEVLDYVASYQERPDDILDKALAAATDAIAAGDDLEHAAATVRLMEPHLAAFWQAAAGA